MSQPTTRVTNRPSQRDSLEAVVRHRASKFDAAVEIASMTASLQWPGARVTLKTVIDAGAVTTHAAPDANIDWLQLASAAAEIHREAGRVIALHHTHMESPR